MELIEMGLNATLASYLTLALSPHLASHGLQANKQKRNQLEKEYRLIMKNRTIQQVFDQATFTYNINLFV